MHCDKSYPIWNPDTGIKELERSPAELGASEIPGIKAIWTAQRERLKDTYQLKDFTEKLSREWAIETGIIENIYEIERGVTQTLIEHGFQSEYLSHGSTNKPREYVIQLLKDQKDALDGIFAFVKSDRSLTSSYIKELHAALLRNQQTTEGLDAHGEHVDIPLLKGTWKSQPNYPVRDGVTFTYCPPEHVNAEIDRLIDISSEQDKNDVPSEVKAAWLHHRFTQIHPFQDGNGRVARAIASLVLVKDGLFPLVITRNDKTRYLTALEKADHGDLKPLVELITKSQKEQFFKATKITEELLREEDVQAALLGLRRASEKIAAEKYETLKEVFEFARIIEDEIDERLKVIVHEVSDALKRVTFDARAVVRRSNPNTDHYFRAQIVQTARDQIGYYANTSVYRSWISMNLIWTRRGQLVFAVHGIGEPFNGSLICAPFLEFKDYDDSDDERQLTATIVPVDDEGFVFFYNENIDRILDRFRSWRENVLRIALRELSQNL